jgi:hypothetical protein
VGAELQAPAGESQKDEQRHEEEGSKYASGQSARGDGHKGVSHRPARGVSRVCLARHRSPREGRLTGRHRVPMQLFSYISVFDNISVS